MEEIVLLPWHHRVVPVSGGTWRRHSQGQQPAARYVPTPRSLAGCNFGTDKGLGRDAVSPGQFRRAPEYLGQSRPALTSASAMSFP